MARYDIPQALVEDTVRKPDRMVAGHGGRKVAQKRLDGYVLRVVVEEREGLRVIVTVYQARGRRYEV